MQNLNKVSRKFVLLLCAQLLWMTFSTWKKTLQLWKKYEEDRHQQSTQSDGGRITQVGKQEFCPHAVELNGLHDLYETDLVEMIPYMKVNKGYKYMITIINAFRKFAYAVPLK